MDNCLHRQSNSSSFLIDHHLKYHENRIKRRWLKNTELGWISIRWTYIWSKSFGVDWENYKDAANLYFLKSSPSPAHLLNESFRVKASFIEHFSSACFTFQSRVQKEIMHRSSQKCIILQNLTWLLPCFCKLVDLTSLARDNGEVFRSFELLFSLFIGSLPRTCSSYTLSNSHHETWIVEIEKECNHSVLQSEETEGQPPANVE